MAESAAANMRVWDATKTTAVIKMTDRSSIPRYCSPKLAIKILMPVVTMT